MGVTMHVHITSAEIPIQWQKLLQEKLLFQHWLQLACKATPPPKKEDELKT